MTVADFLKDAAQREPGKEVQISVRSFISKWGAKRRGYTYVRQISRDLEKYGLETVPPFDSGWIDNKIRIQKVQPQAEPSTANDDKNLSEAKPDALTVLGLRVGRLRSASAGVVSVRREDSLIKAQSVMLRHDYSQLAVLAGSRKVLGALSWESISKARMHAQGEIALRSCLTKAIVVDIDDDLLQLIPQIIEAGFVFVKSKQDEICGIITTADLSMEFQTLAGPFLLIGEIERKLRRIVDANFEVDVLQQIANPAMGGRVVKTADDLTVGEYVRLFEAPERWDSLNWALDRNTFLSSLKEFNEVRNDIMHFGPDPIEPEVFGRVRNLLKWLTFFDAN